METGDTMSYFDSTIWNYLKSAPPKGAAITARRAFPGITPFLLAGLDAEGRRHFLVPLLANEETIDDRQSRGLIVKCEDLQVKEESHTRKFDRYINIVCQDPAGEDSFDMIGHEIATSLVSGSAAKAETVRNILAKWRHFWGRPPSSALSREELIGLFAEIWYLNRWLLPHMKPMAAISGWRGPHGSRHDFEWAGKSIEVKGTTSNRGRIHQIHGLEQLSPPENGVLFLFSLVLREEGGATNTLPNIIAECRAMITDAQDALEYFENSLVLAGYSPMHDEEYNKIRFRVADEALFAVRDNFPRIVVGSFQEGIPSGVNAINYEINLDGYNSLIVARASNEKKD